MGGTTWTADRDAKLFLLLLPYINVPKMYDQLAAKWKEAYPNETYKPTPRALQERILNLKKQNDSEPKGATTPQTPKTPSVLKTPTSSAKRPGGKILATTPSKRGRSSGKAKQKDESDEDELATNDDDSDAELAQQYTGPPRKTLSRRSKKPGVKYVESSVDDDDADDEDINELVDSMEIAHEALPAAATAVAGSSAAASPTKDPSKESQDGSGPVDEGIMAMDNRESDSDISTYDPLA